MTGMAPGLRAARTCTKRNLLEAAQKEELRPRLAIDIADHLHRRSFELCRPAILTALCSRSLSPLQAPMVRTYAQLL